MRDFTELCEELAVIVPMTNYNEAKLKLVRLFYTRVRGESREITDCQLDDGFRDIIKWYKMAFPNEVDSGNGAADNGITRRTKANTAAYQFDNHLNDDSIRNINDDSIDTHQDTLLHLLVAMCASVDECNDILKAFGFAKLHSRNVHHIAIYSVLLEHEKSRHSNDNLFPLIKERYFRALEIIGRAEAHKTNISENSNVIRDTSYFDGELLKWKDISFDGFERYFDGFIESNAVYFNWKYNRLMDEHFRLAVLFRYFLSDKVWKARRDAGFGNCCSLEDFINTLCRPMDKKFKSHAKKNGEETVSVQYRNIYMPHLLKYIYEDGKYPTREVMIILWLFKYCFGAMPIVKCPGGFTKKMNKVVKDLNEKKPCPGSVPNDFSEYLIHDADGKKQKAPKLQGEDVHYLFDVHRYLFGKSANSASPIWGGADVVFKINEELDKYGWQMLSGNSQFDSAIMMLKHVTVNMDTVTVKFERETASANVYSYFDCDNCVPPALAASFGVLKLMQEALFDEDSAEKLLHCDLYSAEI